MRRNIIIIIKCKQKINDDVCPFCLDWNPLEESNRCAAICCFFRLFIYSGVDANKRGGVATIVYVQRASYCFTQNGRAIRVEGMETKSADIRICSDHQSRPMKQCTIDCRSNLINGRTVRFRFRKPVAGNAIWKTPLACRVRCALGTMFRWKHIFCSLIHPYSVAATLWH